MLAYPERKELKHAIRGYNTILKVQKSSLSKIDVIRLPNIKADEQEKILILISLSQKYIVQLWRNKKNTHPALHALSLLDSLRSGSLSFNEI